MTVAEAKKLKPQDRVRWSADGALGTVAETSYAAIKIKWDDGQWLLLPFADEKAPWQRLELAPVVLRSSRGSSKEPKL